MKLLNRVSGSAPLFQLAEQCGALVSRAVCGVCLRLFHDSDTAWRSELIWLEPRVPELGFPVLVLLSVPRYPGSVGAPWQCHGSDKVTMPCRPWASSEARAACGAPWLSSGSAPAGPWVLLAEPCNSYRWEPQIPIAFQGIVLHFHCCYRIGCANNSIIENMIRSYFWLCAFICTNLSCCWLWL